MTRLHNVLCPIDFSAPSRAALRYAIAIAEHYGSRLTVMTVADPLLAEAAAIQGGADWLVHDCDRELRRFVDQTMDHRSAFALEIEYVVAGGNPAQEILKAMADRHCDLVVMSTHGLTGIRKLFFGATTERVLRETTVPVLVTPPHEPGPLYLDEIASLVRRVLVPVDLSAVGERQVQVAAGLAAELRVPLLLAHVVEPLRFPMFAVTQAPHIDTERRVRAEQALEGLASRLPSGIKAEAITVFGDPAEEIAKLARGRGAGLIVVGLHASALAGPRMGSVTYRVLCLAQRLVLALPPAEKALRRPVPAVSADVVSESASARPKRELACQLS